MTDVVFAFGPENSYFMTSPTKWAWKNLPDNVYNRFHKTDGHRIVFVHHMVLGANGSYYVGWRGKDGSDYQVHKGLPDHLAKWLDEKNPKTGYCIRSSVSIRIALGPGNKSFWAICSKDSLWWQLPANLEAKFKTLQDKKGRWTDMPRIVALGVNDSYFLATASSAGQWNLQKHYPGLAKEADKWRGKFDQIHHVSLDQHNAANFVLTLTNGGAGWHVPDALGVDMEKIVTSIPKGVASRPVSTKRGSSGVKRALLAGVLTGVAKGLAGQQQQQMNFNGGGGGGMAFDNMAFTAGLQQQMWSTVDDAAQF